MTVSRIRPAKKHSTATIVMPVTRIAVGKRGTRPVCEIGEHQRDREQDQRRDQQQRADTTEEQDRALDAVERDDRLQDPPAVRKVESLE